MLAFNTNLVALTLSLCSIVYAATSDEWRSRTIYQVLTDRFALTNGSTTQPCDTQLGLYCGGSWNGIREKLDYIQDMGFDAVWISPVTYQLQGNTADGSAYHGYWQQNLYEVNSNFGTADDLRALSTAMHNRGMYLMVDIVTNHFAFNSAPADIVYSELHPFNEKSYYHSFCEIDYEDTANITQIQVCWEGDQKVPLVDLRTEDANVVDEFKEWIQGLVANYSIDGLRIDSVTEVDYDFWTPFMESANVYAVGEVDYSNSAFVCGYQQYLPGVLNYATYYSLIGEFNSTAGDVSTFANTINQVKNDCKDTSLLGTFSENHDQPRFASLTPDMSLARNVVTFTMLSDGIPIIYEGQEQHYNAEGGSSTPYNREAVWLSDYNEQAPLYTLIQTLNAIRKHAMTEDSSYLTYQNYPIYSDTTTIALRKGNVLTVLSNKGANGASYSLTLASGFGDNTPVTELLTCDTLKTSSSGNLAVPMANGQPRIYYPTASLAGSGLCGASSSKKTRSLDASPSSWKPRQANPLWASKSTR